jgi:hypothetical protein
MGAVLRFMITQSGAVFGVARSHSCYADFSVSAKTLGRDVLFGDAA